MSKQPADRRGNRLNRLRNVAKPETPAAPAVAQVEAPVEAVPVATAPTKKAQAKKSQARKAPKRDRGTRPGGAPEGTTWLATYLPLELHSDMRDAYMWQLDHTDDPATSIARWISRAVIDHCERSAQDRAALRQQRPAAKVAGTKGHTTRPFAVPDATLAALAAAEVDDRAAGFSATRAETVATAIWKSVEDTRRAAGGTLPHFTGRLPSKPQPATRA